MNNDENSKKRLPIGVTKIGDILADEDFKITEVSDDNDVTIHTLTVNHVTYELVDTEDNHKYIYSSSKIFRKGFKVSDSAERLVMVGKQLMVVNEDDSLDELVDLADANIKVVSVEHKIYLSPRGIPLVYMGSKPDKPVITCENTSKWYKLFLVEMDGEVSTLNCTDTGFFEWIDHCPKPEALVEHAEAHNFYVDEQSLEMMIGRIAIEKDHVLDNSFQHDNILSAN